LTVADGPIGAHDRSRHPLATDRWDRIPPNLENPTNWLQKLALNTRRKETTACEEQQPILVTASQAAEPSCSALHVSLRDGHHP
jgi:hypothetical protein